MSLRVRRAGVLAVAFVAGASILRVSSSAALALTSGATDRGRVAAAPVPRPTPEAIFGDGAQRIETFGSEPWPHWIYKLPDGTRIELELFAVHGDPMTCLSWKVFGPRG